MLGPLFLLLFSLLFPPGKQASTTQRSFPNYVSIYPSIYHNPFQLLKFLKKKTGHKRQLLPPRPTTPRELYRSSQGQRQREGAVAGRLRPQLLHHGHLCGRPRRARGEVSFGVSIFFLYFLAVGGGGRDGCRDVRCEMWAETFCIYSRGGMKL